MAEPADEMHVSLTDCRGRNHDGENSHEYSSPESPDSLGSLPELVDLEHSNFCAELADWAPNTENDHALIALQTAGSMENQHKTNVAELALELSPRQSSRADVECYKEICEKGNAMGYYDAFKRRSDKKGLAADLARLEIADWFSDIFYNREEPEDRQMAITRLESSRKRLHPGSFVTITMINRFWNSDGHNFDIESLDPTKMTQGAYDTLVDIIEFLEISRLHELLLRAMILCFIAIQIFLGLMVESYDSKAKIQEIKAKIQDKFKYNGNCKVKIGISPCPGG